MVQNKQIGSMIDSVQLVQLVVCLFVCFMILYMKDCMQSTLCMKVAMSRQSHLQETKSIDAGFCTHLHHDGLPNKLCKQLDKRVGRLIFSSIINK